MTSVVLAWVAVTIGYIIIRASVSLQNMQGADIVYGVYVLVVEVSPPLSYILPVPLATHLPTPVRAAEKAQRLVLVVHSESCLMQCISDAEAGFSGLRH